MPFWRQYVNASRHCSIVVGRATRERVRIEPTSEFTSCHAMKLGWVWVSDAMENLLSYHPFENPVRVLQNVFYPNQFQADIVAVAG